MILKRDPAPGMVKGKETEYIYFADPPGRDFEQDILQFLEGKDMARKYSTRMKNYENYRTKPFVDTDKVFDLVKETLKSSLLALTELRRGYFFNLDILGHVLKMIDQHKTTEEIKKYILECLESQSKMEDSKDD